MKETEGNQLKLSQLTIVDRLRLFVAFLFLVLLTLAAINSQTVNRLSVALEDLSATQLPATRFIDMADMQHDSIRASAVESLLWTSAKGEGELKRIEQSLTEASQIFQENLDQLKTLALADKKKGDLGLIREQAVRYIDSGRTLIQEVRSLDHKRRDAAFSQLSANFEVLKTSMEELGTELRKDADQAMRASLEMKARSERLTLGLSFASIVLVLIFGLSLVRNVKVLLKEMVERLEQQAKEISELSFKVLGAASSLASSTEQQSAAISESAAAVEEITTMARLAAENALKLEKSTLSSEQTAKKGSESTKVVVGAITEIVSSFRNVLSQVESSDAQMKEILHVIANISTKTQIINDIALESKILSFNASVEAARAGEHGKGFSVVAEEIGKLALTSVEASSEITQLIQNSVRSVETILHENKNRVSTLVLESETKLKDGVSLAEVCAGELDQIVELSRLLSQTAIEISKASREQSTGLQQISSTMTLFEESNHLNAETSKDCSVYSENLKHRSVQLDKMVDFVARISA